MPVWKTPAVFIKNVIADSWDEDVVMTLIGSDDKLKKTIDDMQEEFFQEGYIEFDFSHWTSRDFEKVRQAAVDRLKHLKELDE